MEGKKLYAAQVLRTFRFPSGGALLVAFAFLVTGFTRCTPSFAVMSKRAMPQPIVFVTGNAKKLEEARRRRTSGHSQRPLL